MLAASLAGLILASAGCGRSPDGETEGQRRGLVRGALGAELDRFLTESAAQGFSGAVLVVKEGEVILEKGYGLANRAYRVPNTAETVFNICSLSKIFTASAVLHLEMEGKLEVGDSLEKYLGNFPSQKSSATIHHLLTHTAGLVVARTAIDGSSRAAFIQGMKDAPVESASGEEYRYTNVGYSLLAALVEEVSGQSFESYVREHLLEPAGMSRTSFLGEPAPDGFRLAHGYPEGPEGQLEPVDLGPFGWGLRGAGGMLASVGDLYKWDRALREGSVLSEDTTKKMFTPYFGDEGYGWHVAETDWGTTVHHRGCGNPGFGGQFARYPEDDVVVIFMINNRNRWRRPIWQGIEGIVFPEQGSKR